MAVFGQSLLGSSIDDLKSVFSKRQGPAQANRFMLFMIPPRASLLNIDVGAAISGALSGDLSLGSFFNDPRDVSVLCESCTLPGRSVLTQDVQREKQMIKVPYSFTNEDVTFTFLLTNDYYMRKMFDNWLGLAFNTKDYNLQYKDQYTTDVRIAQLNKKNIPTYIVKLENAYPTAINAITLDNTAENSIQKVTVNMTYENFVVENLVQAGLGAGKQLAGIATSLLG
jgi:hypothetical protein